MKLVFLKKFSKDLDKISSTKDKQSILETIELVRSAKSSKEITGIKKLKGFDDAYRLRSGNYRVGIFMENDSIIFARVAHRKDIYKIFP